MLCAGALLSTPAHADHDAPDEQAARNHFARGVTLYDNGQYEEAIREFSIARALRPRPAFFFDIGRCQERLENWAEAADSFTRYLETASDLQPAAREELQARIRVLRERAERARESSAAPIAASPMTPAPSVALGRSGRAPLRLGAVLVGVTAGVTAIVGTALVLSVGPAYRQLETSCRQRPCGPADTEGLRTQLDGGYALWAVAGAAALTDVVLIAVTVRRTSQRRAFLAPGTSGLVLGSEL
jgi:tetratricopeptide (TPR) repeat protein